MSPVYFWVRVVVGVVFLLVTLVYWVWGERRHSLAMRWLSLMNVALEVCAFFSASEQLANPHALDLWWAPERAVLFLAGCALVVGGIYVVREMQRGSGMQRHRP